MRGDRPFAYDLVTEDGAVNSRVALLLRSIEAKPRFLTSVLAYKTPHFYSLIIYRLLEGVFTGFKFKLIFL
jgi:hypothetical protein